MGASRSPARRHERPAPRPGRGLAGKRVVRLAGPLLAAALLGAIPAGAGAQEMAPPPEPPARAGEESPRRGWLGVGLDHHHRCPGEAVEARRAESCPHVLVVETVVLGSPADEAGVLPGDTLLAVDSRNVLTADGELDLPAFRVGEETRLLLGREGERITLAITPGERPGHAGMVPMKVHRVRSRPAPPGERPARPVEAGNPHPILVAPVPAAHAARDAAERVMEARARMIHDSVLAAARAQLDSVRVIRREQMEELHERLRETRRTLSESRREEVSARLERALEHRAEEMRHLDSVFSAWEWEWDPPEVSAPEASAWRGAGWSSDAEGPSSRVHRLGGAELLVLHPELAESFPGVERGLLVLRTLPGTPIAAAGLRPGDVIVEVSDRPIAGASDLRRALLGHAERDSTVVTWVRRGETMRGAMHDR